MGNSIICEEEKNNEEILDVPYKAEIDRLKSYKQNQLIDILNSLPPEKKERLAFDIRKTNFPIFDHILYKYGPNKIVEEPIIHSRQIYLKENLKFKYYQHSERLIFEKKLCVFFPVNCVLDRSQNNYDSILEESPFLIGEIIRSSIAKIEKIEMDILKSRGLAVKELIYLIFFYPQCIEKQIKFIKEKVVRRNSFFIKNEDLPLFDEHGKICVDSNFRMSSRDTGVGGILKTALNSNIVEKLQNSLVEKIFIQPFSNLKSQIIDWNLLEMSLISKSDIFLSCYRNSQNTTFEKDKSKFINHSFFLDGSTYNQVQSLKNLYPIRDQRQLGNKGPEFQSHKNLTLGGNTPNTKQGNQGEFSKSNFLKKKENSMESSFHQNKNDSISNSFYQRKEIKENTKFYENENNSVISILNLATSQKSFFYFSSEVVLDTNFLHQNYLEGRFNLSKCYRIYETSGNFYDNGDLKLKLINLKMLKLNLKDFVVLSNNINVLLYSENDFLLLDKQQQLSKYFSE